ncbi:MAG: DUF4097 family beta strand repeat-containing protein [Pseudomonadota bacterium]
MTALTQNETQQSEHHGSPMVTHLLAAGRLRRSVSRKIPVMLVLGFLLGVLVSVPVLADRERVDQRMPFDGGRVSVSVVRGEVHVEGWDQNEIHVVGLLDEETREFVFETSGNSARIQVKLPRNTHWCCSKGSDLHIRIPMKSRANVNVVSADATVANLQDDTKITVVSGDADVRSIVGALNVGGVSGTVKAHDIEGDLSVNLVSGRLTASELVSGQINVSSVSGDIRLSDWLSDSISAGSVSGDINLSNGRFHHLKGRNVSGGLLLNSQMDNDGSASYNSVSGSITVIVDDIADTHISVEARSGRIRNDLDGTPVTRNRYGPGRYLDIVNGSGERSYRLVSQSGRISVQGSD